MKRANTGKKKDEKKLENAFLSSLNTQKSLTYDTFKRYNFGEHRTVSVHFFDRANTVF